MEDQMRIEKDSLGELQVPKSAYYGVQTARAIANFPISGLRPHPFFIRSTGMVKWAAADTNMALKKLNPAIGKTIQQAAVEVMDGKWNDQFIVDVFQAGAGTSHNMNTNEVIANRAIEMLGGLRGEYQRVHPNDHVNMSQSTNDIFPTAMRVAALLMCMPLASALSHLEKTLLKKAREFNNVIKSGRTHLQDAVPIRMGQEFSGYARAIALAIQNIEAASIGLHEIGLGGSAAGTGINTDPRYAKKVAVSLSKISGLQLQSGKNLFERMQSLADFVTISSALKRLAVELIRIANDLRLMASGPRTGFNEIVLPPVQPGSSIMPGKVNPVMAEVTNMVCFHVIGNDAAITLAAQAGQMELNVMMPIVNYNLLQSFEILTNTVRLLADRCVAGITANREQCLMYAEKSIGLATILNQSIGYEAAAMVAKTSMQTGKSLREIVIEKGILSAADADRIFDPMKMTTPGE
ncbi:MAG: aspartate ammonia-lyase [Nitrospirota bacterium]